MKQKPLWIITIILLVIHLLIQNIFIHRYNYSDTLDIISFVIDLFSNIIIVVILGGLLAALTAFVPSNQKTYNERFMKTFPKSLSVVLLILIGIFIWIYYMMLSIDN